MIPHALFDAAMEFKKNKLWKHIKEDQLFALTHSDGTVGYCCVTGEAGDVLALNCYPEEGLPGLWKIMDTAHNIFHADFMELLRLQRCASLSLDNIEDLPPADVREARAYFAEKGITPRGKHSYPRFMQLAPGYVPWSLNDETDRLHLLEALEASFEISRRVKEKTPRALGFHSVTPDSRSIPLLRKTDGGYAWDRITVPMPEEPPHPTAAWNDIQLVHLKKCKRSGATWLLDVFPFHEAVVLNEDDVDEDGMPHERPFYPYMLLVGDAESEIILQVTPSDVPGEDYSLAFTSALLALAKQVGIPRAIQFCTDRAEAFLSGLTAPMGTMAERRKRIPELAYMRDCILSQSMTDEEDFSDMDDMPEDAFELLDLLRSPTFVRELPDELLDQLLPLAQRGDLPEDVSKNILREDKRRS